MCCAAYTAPAAKDAARVRRGLLTCPLPLGIGVAELVSEDADSDCACPVPRGASGLLLQVQLSAAWSGWFLVRRACAWASSRGPVTVTWGGQSGGAGRRAGLNVRVVGHLGSGTKRVRVQNSVFLV